MIEVKRFILIGCLLQASPPKPKFTTEKVEVMEGTSVSLSCSAAAPCPKLPPNLTWTPSLSDSVDQLQENEDQTKSVSSVITFTASHLHHGQKITCRALYKLQQGDIQKSSNTSLTLRVLYPPKNTSVSISPSGSVLEGSSVTLTCSSNANPPVQHYTWYKVNGREMNTVGTGQNLTFNVTESSGSEQYYCEAQNKHGKENSPTVQLEVDHFSITWLLIGASAVAMVIAFLIMMLILKKKRDSRCSGNIMKDIKAGVMDGSPPPAEDPIYANHAMATTPPRAPELGGTDPQTLPLAEGQIGEQLEGMHYASIKHSPQSVETQGQDWAAGRGADVVYSQVAVKRKCPRSHLEGGNSENGLRGAGNLRDRPVPHQPSLQGDLVPVPLPPMAQGVRRPRPRGRGGAVPGTDVGVGLTPGGGLLSEDRGLRLADDGVRLYTWINPDESSSQRFYEQTVTLKVTGMKALPQISVQDQIAEGSALSLNCTIRHSCPISPPALIWAGLPESHNTSASMSPDVTQGVWLSRATVSWRASWRDNGRVINCLAQLDHLVQSRSPDICLDVSHAPVDVNLTAEKLVIREGEAVTLRCHSNGNPLPTLYRWLESWGGQTVQLDSSVDEVSVPSVRRDSSYSCMAQNPLGRCQSNWLSLNVQFSPVILSGTTCFGTGGALRCVCRAEAHPKATLHWTVNGTDYPASFASAVERNGGVVSAVLSGPLEHQLSVSCTAHNSLGNVTRHLPIDTTIGWNFFFFFFFLFTVVR
ncbi:hypothetical protein SKAU_G00418900 [Synaphobranchus kaupii]|uniref:Ig-like domain-containing protein n=1 Tax=Synaphobranchus kaupii TaxID=118154 RepID=A0A9Q1E685_SYNKA|nr:hypothetical protein SKAU_G00418900 [Synaphobranchus kaupii]